MCQNIPVCYRSECNRSEPLSLWNQHAPRAYISVALCFPFDNRQEQKAVRHLGNALKQLGRNRPTFAARLHADENGKACLDRSSSYEIPFTHSSGGLPKAKSDYADMANQGFPPGLFVEPGCIPDGTLGAEPLPVAKVHAAFTKGGLLLTVCLHHAAVDGASIRMFLECFSGHTSGDAAAGGLDSLPADQLLPQRLNPSNQGWSVICKAPTTRQPRSERPDANSRSTNEASDSSVFSPASSQVRALVPNMASARALLSRCPEYTILKDRSGPTQPKWLEGGKSIDDIERIGKIFVFKNARLEQLKALMQTYHGNGDKPTAYTALAALTWTHVLKARIDTEMYLPDRQARPQVCSLWNPVDLRNRVYNDINRYFGNASYPVVTLLPTERVMSACEDERLLARLVPEIKARIGSVDENYSKLRMFLMMCYGDPRMLGINYDPRMAEALHFNTWRHFGADAEWTIPGVPVKKPDAVRRLSCSFNLGTALILPAKTESRSQELYISISKTAMQRLCSDEGWMKFVDRVIG